MDKKFIPSNQFTKKENIKWKCQVAGIILLAVVILGFIIFDVCYTSKINKDGFQSRVIYEDPFGSVCKYNYNNKNKPKYVYNCSNCTGLDRTTCNLCSNCNYCISPNSKGECVMGSSYGPEFRKDCIVYEHLGKTSFEDAYKDNVLGLYNDNSNIRILYKEN